MIAEEVHGLLSHSVFLWTLLSAWSASLSLLRLRVRSLTWRYFAKLAYAAFQFWVSRWSSAASPAVLRSWNDTLHVLSHLPPPPEGADQQLWCPSLLKSFCCVPVSSTVLVNHQLLSSWKDLKPGCWTIKTEACIPCPYSWRKMSVDQNKEIHTH